MKKRFLAFALTLCLGLNISSASAAGLYSDVPEDASYQDAISYVSEKNYMFGYSDHSFRSDSPVTLKQLCVVLGRALGLKPGDDAVRYAVNQTYINPGLLPDSVLNGVIAPDAAMAIVGRGFGVLPTHGESITYPAYSDSDAARYMRGAGVSLGVFDFRIDEILRHKNLTRGDLAYLVSCFDKYDRNHPEITDYGWGYVKISVVGPYDYLRLDAWDDILILPWPVLQHFHDAGYQITCGEAGVSRFDLHDMSVVGVFSPVDKTIFVQDIDGVIHAMGHYVSTFMVGLTEATAAFPRERAAAAEYIAPNAGYDTYEFFAECFNYYIRAKNANNYASMSMMSERMPEIWAFITNMDVLGWHAAAKYVAPDVVGSGVFPVDFVAPVVYCRYF